MTKQLPPVIVYQQVCQKLEFNYCGYNVGRIMKPVLHDVLVRHSNWKAKSTWLFIRPLTFKKFPRVDTDVFMTFPSATQHRTDYTGIRDFVQSKIKHDTQLLNFVERKVYNFGAKHYFGALLRVVSLSNINLKQRAQIWVHLVCVLKTIDNAEAELQINCKKYVSFFSVLWVENLLTQYFKKRNIPTYNLQHGLIFYQVKNPLDIVQHSNIESDYHLAWGQYTKDELYGHGITNSEILIAGYPKPKIKTALKKPQNYACTIFLARRDYDAENKALLTLLHQYNQSNNYIFTFNIKLHPNLNFEEYAHYLTSNTMNAQMYLLPMQNTIAQILASHQTDFCLAVNTTTYYECYTLGLVCLRYHAPAFEQFYNLADDVFTDINSFGTCIHNLYHCFNVKFNNDSIRNKLNYVIGCDEDNYAKMLNY